MEDNNIKLDKGEVNVKNVAIVGCVIIGFIGWFYSSVVIPLSNVQVQLAQIQATLKTSAQNYSALQTQVTQNSTDITILKQQIKQ